MCFLHHKSSKVFPGPVSKPCICPDFGRKVIFAMPPMLTITRFSSSEPKQNLWKAGASGAPCPPRAMSARLKSETTLHSVSTANMLGFPNWILNPILSLLG